MLKVLGLAKPVCGRRSAQLERLIRLLLPFVDVWRASRALPLPEDSEVANYVDEEVVWLLSLGEGARGAAISTALVMEDSRADITRGLESKAIGIVGALSLLTAAVIAIAIVTWATQQWWQRMILLVSGAYSAVALLCALQAVTPRKTYTLTLDAAKDAVSSSCNQAEIRLAAMRMANMRANTNGMIRLSNLVSASRDCTRIAIILSAIFLLTFAIGNTRSVAHPRPARQGRAPGAPRPVRRFDLRPRPFGHYILIGQGSREGAQGTLPSPQFDSDSRHYAEHFRSPPQRWRTREVGIQNKEARLSVAGADGTIRQVLRIVKCSQS